MAVPPIAGWQQKILRRVGAPVTPQNLLFLDDWAKAEGGDAANNPFNTTQRAPGASAYNSVGVRNYTSPLQGLQATVQTLKNGRYGGIIDSLRQGTSARTSAQALAASPWGTGSLVLKMLGGGTTSAPAAPTAPTQQRYQPVPPGTSAPDQARASRLAGLLASTNQQLGLGGNQSMLQQLLASKISGTPTTAAGAPARTMASSSHGSSSAVENARSYLGTPYVYGGSSRKGIDCSALLQQAWAGAGVKIPRTTYEQYKTGRPVSQHELAPGDAVFFRGSDPHGDLPGHVGIYLGSGKFIESPHTGATVRVSNLAGRSDYAGARRYG